MNKMRQFITGTLAVALLGAGSAALADSSTEARAHHGKAHQHAEYGDKRGEYHRHGKSMEQLADKLNLTEEQRQAWQNERASMKGENRVDRSELHEAHKALREARAGNASEQEIAVLRDNLKQLRAQDHAARQQRHERFMAILTPAQREQLEALKAEHRAERKSQHKKPDKEHKKQDKERRSDDGARWQGRAAERLPG